jgi:hypothetical protein
MNDIFNQWESERPNKKQEKMEVRRNVKRTTDDEVLMFHKNLGGVGIHMDGFFDPLGENPYKFYKRRVKPAKESGEVPSWVHFWYPIRNKNGKRIGLGRF